MSRFELTAYPYNEDAIAQRIAKYKAQPLRFFDSEKTACRFLLNCIDLTTLEGSDTEAKVEELCRKAVAFPTAAVCVYPPFVALAKKRLAGTPIHVASVAGAFPAGQSPIEIKVAEVRYAVEQGADEIDMVISRGKFLDGKYDEVFDEIVAIKQAAAPAHLKVILETGELKTPENIFHASQLAIAAGADFIKTSTGKIAVNATPESFLVMLDAIKDHYDKTGKMVGMKPAGGIADADTALDFLKILENVLGEPWLTNRYFRIGASRLANKMAERIAE